MPYNSLTDAIRSGDLDEIRLVIAADPNSVNRFGVGAGGNAPIHIALLCDVHSSIKYEIVSILISSGVDVNVAGENGWTPLHIAARRVEGEIAENLIRAGAVVNISDGFDTPLDISLRLRDYFCIGLFLSHGASISIHGAVIFDRIDWVHWILCENPSAVREWERSDELLRDAIQAGNLEMLRSLITSGATINPNPSYGIHPLWIAVEQGNIEAVRVLLEAGADPNGCRPQTPLPDWRYPGWTSPLEMAKQKGLADVEALLKQFGAAE